MKKIALVTGSTRGIGKAIAQLLCENGYHVILSGTKEKKDIAEILETFSNLDFSYVKCNITNQEDINDMYHYIKEKYNRLDLLVNNAGIAPIVRKNILEVSGDSFSQVLDCNLKGTFFMCQKFANFMIECKTTACNPRIVNISSCSSYTSSPNRGEYCISKAGISMVTKLFADELSKYDIPVFEVQPGIIITDMTATVQKKYEKMIENGLTPTKRMGTPKDVANCVLALSSGLFDFSTGQVINADGGFHLRRL